jgi:hypothetical protein
VIGRRLQPVDGKLPFDGTMDERWQPGDYCGPIMGYTGSVPMVMYRLPNGSIGHVCSPPHTFRECSDGSLEIRNSILHHFTDDAGNDTSWHGFLDEGNLWRE